MLWWENCDAWKAAIKVHSSWNENCCTCRQNFFTSSRYWVVGQELSLECFLLSNHSLMHAPYHHGELLSGGWTVRQHTIDISKYWVIGVLGMERKTQYSSQLMLALVWYHWVSRNIQSTLWYGVQLPAKSEPDLSFNVRSTWTGACKSVRIIETMNENWRDMAWFKLWSINSWQRVNLLSVFSVVMLIYPMNQSHCLRLNPDTVKSHH
jgi:hypothetical protein